MKILIAVPAMEQVQTKFVVSLEGLIRAGATSVAFSESSLVGVSRDQLAQQAIHNGFDYVLWIDSDMTFPDTALVDLLKDIQENKSDIDIVTGLCFRRRPPYTPAIWKRLRMGIGEEKVTEDYNEYPKNELFEIDACGMAFCLMKTEVLSTVLNKDNNLFSHIPGYGEDLSLCIRAKRAGFRIWCDSRVKIGHIGQTVIDEYYYEKSRRAF